MARAVVVAIHIEPVDYEFGGWCRSCLLPSGLHVLVMVTVNGRSELRTFDRCVDCGGDQVEPPDVPDVDHL